MKHHVHCKPIIIISEHLYSALSFLVHKMTFYWT